MHEGVCSKLRSEFEIISPLKLSVCSRRGQMIWSMAAA